jgi:osmotically-inducible protein OsmY
MSKLIERTARSSDAIDAPALPNGLWQREDRAVAQAIRRRIAENRMYAFYFKDVTCECHAGVVTVRGRVPTDGLKKVLWSFIEILDGVDEIDDQLDVINSRGLSHVRPK